MASNVVKKDGTKEPFNPEKIRNSIRAAAGQAGLLEERKNEVVEQVATTAIQVADGKEEIATSEIREKILSDLDRIEPSVSAAWRKYDQEKKGV
jgi:transcriptional repressor NrdR